MYTYYILSLFKYTLFKKLPLSGIIVGTTAVQFPTPQIYTFDWNRPGAFFLLYGKTVLLSGVYAGAQ